MTSMRRAVLGAAIAVAALAAAAGPASASPANAVYTSTNSAVGNRVLAFDRTGNGSLKPDGSFSTGGTGTGAGLGSQGAVALSRAGHLLYVVNAGSDSITTFAAGPHGLRSLASTPSGGNQPISLTVRRDLLYALNAGSGTISAFSGARDGRLQPLSGSTTPIAGSGPAQVQFSNDGGVLVVTDKDTNTIDTFEVGADGQPRPAQSQPSNGQTPFGFDFDRRGLLIVSEAFGGAPAASTLSSYSLSSSGLLSAISASVPDNQSAACWVEVTGDGRFAYTTNTGS